MVYYIIQLRLLVGLSGEQILAILVEMQLCDFDVGGVDGDGDRLAIDLVLVDLFNVDAPFEAVDLHDLALAALPRAARDLDNVVLADGHGIHAVLLLEVLGERGGHDASALGRRGGKVGLAGLAAGAGDHL